MNRTIPVAVAVAAVIACGVVHGYWTDRWVTGGRAGRGRQPWRTAADGRRMGRPRRRVESAGEDVAGYHQRRYYNRKTTGSSTIPLRLRPARPGVDPHARRCSGASGFVVGTKRKVGVGEQRRLLDRRRGESGRRRGRECGFTGPGMTAAAAAADDPR